MLMTIMNSLF